MEAQQRRPFARYFETETHGQLVAILRTATDQQGTPPEIVLFFDAGIKTPGLGVSQATLAFDDSTEGWTMAEEALDTLTADIATQVVDDMLPAVKANKTAH